ncbi:MAG: hypothetical protein ACXVC6_03770 [Bacteroidia bacterium]
MSGIFSTSVPTRLSFVKSIVALTLFVTIASTWRLWVANRTFPVFPGSDSLSSVNLIVAFAIPVLLAFSLIMIFLLRKPRFFTILASLLCGTLLILDAGRSHYWFYFYLMILLLLGGYNWRVDNANSFTTFFLAIKIMVAGVYVLAAIQHFQSDFIHTMWPQFIKPFERFWTPEQCAYLAKVAYVVPLIELFIAVGLFFPNVKIASISFAILFHLFSFSVLFMQPQAEVAVLLWHCAMMLLVTVVFAGTPAGQKNQMLSLNFYPVFALFVFGIALPGYFLITDKPLKNKIDFMQNNAGEQFVYVNEESKSKLPLYVQSFADKKENGYCKLSVTRWALHETNTKQILGVNHLMQLSNSLNQRYGTEALVAIPAQTEKFNTLALK